ncbi:hypothetical protein HETIRDRAFT_390472 [Heterobasidion irregulare TC 32-1]|uniref:Uncharacterized protein n=1 Tax=Heterobasidion irregulare (strain TC 32-1) TaxID=747525 RepID=W4JR63_HETIT|nr:uncharacterized protein HETIRDRAFT_390472 [Heterobasidion irregulare TC 32-1]ETW76062.1 hypothetical protein HETIRDRAFT_390472 [Heterobasidion irregulare TC 32-1]
MTAWSYLELLVGWANLIFTYTVCAGHAAVLLGCSAPRAELAADLFLLLSVRTLLYRPDDVEIPNSHAIIPCTPV